MPEPKGKKLSVIIPAHNPEQTISPVLESVLNQELDSELEVIVVNNASTDHTVELVKRYPVLLLELKENQGAGSALNYGAERAGGEILVFVGAALVLLPGSLKLIEDFFAQNPEFAGVVGNYTALPGDNNFASVYHNLFTVYHHQLTEPGIEWFWGALSAVRREVFLKLGGFNTTYPGAGAEDIELGYRLAEAGYKICYLPELRGIHLQRIKLSTMLYNDYHKSVLGLKLYLTRKPRGAYPYGFSNPVNGVNLFLVFLSWLAFLGLILAGSMSYFLVLLVFWLVNFRFYQFIRQKAGMIYLLAGLILHWLGFNAIALGVLGGMAGLILGKGLESRSKWI